MTELEQQLIQFAKWVIAEHRCAFGDLDGGSIQDKLEELGLPVPVKVDKPCGDNCTCEEYGDFPQDCLRLVKGLTL